MLPYGGVESLSGLMRIDTWNTRHEANDYKVLFTFSCPPGFLKNSSGFIQHPATRHGFLTCNCAVDVHSQEGRNHV